MVAPLAVWAEAEKQAQRSPLLRFRTGAVIFDSRDGRIASRGCSHSHDGGRAIGSIHAEHHALENLFGDESLILSCAVVTLTRNDNWARSSRPCGSCCSLLIRAAVREVAYAREDLGTWVVDCESPIALLDRFTGARSGFARQLRIQ